MEGNRASVTLHRVVGLIAAFKLTFDLFTMVTLALALTVSHFFLALALDDFALPGVPFPLPVELGRSVLHGLTNSGEGMAAVMRRACWVLAVRGRLVLTSVRLA
jgi:hypothetical protein